MARSVLHTRVAAERADSSWSLSGDMLVGELMAADGLGATSNMCVCADLVRLTSQLFPSELLAGWCDGQRARTAGRIGRRARRGRWVAYARALRGVGAGGGQGRARCVRCRAQTALLSSLKPAEWCRHLPRLAMAGMASSHLDLVPLDLPLLLNSPLFPPARHHYRSLCRQHRPYRRNLAPPSIDMGTCRS